MQKERPMILYLRSVQMCNSNYAFQDNSRAILNMLPVLTRAVFSCLQLYNQKPKNHRPTKCFKVNTFIFFKK